MKKFILSMIIISCTILARASNESETVRQMQADYAHSDSTSEAGKIICVGLIVVSVVAMILGARWALRQSKKHTVNSKKVGTA